MANEQSNALTRKLFMDYELDRSDVFASEKQGFQIITRTGIEKIQYKENIVVSFDVIKAEPTFCCVKAIASKGGRVIETLASATKGEFRNVEKKGRNGQSYSKKVLTGGNTDSWYVVEMAEKRALSRAILKVTGLYEYGFFGEDENLEEFKPKAEKNKKKGEDIVNNILDGLP